MKYTRLGYGLLGLVLMASTAFALDKISERTTATTLDGTETVGIIQGGVDKKTALSTLTNAGAVSTTGVPAAGFIGTAGTATATGCAIKMAGGDMGTLAVGGNFIMDCAEQDGTAAPSGVFMQVSQHDNGNQPKDLFSVNRNGITNMQGLMVTQGGYSKGGWVGGIATDNYFGFNYAKENTTGRTLGITTFQSDVPSLLSPIVATWGVTSAVYAGNRPPLYHHYGSTWLNSALYNATFGSKIDGTLLSSQEDNGNTFSNQLVRTTAAYTNATTTLGIVSTVTGSGALVVPITTGRSYDFHAKLYITSATGGIKLAVNSSTTASAIRYDAVCIHHAGTPAITSSGFATSLATAVAAASTSLSSGALCTIDGTITMSGGASTTITMDCASASAVCTTGSTTGVVANQLVTQRGGACDVIAPNSYVVSRVVDTSVTLSRNSQCDPASITYNFLDSVWIEAASNAAGTLTVAQGSTFELKGSLNGGAY